VFINRFQERLAQIDLLIVLLPEDRATAAQCRQPSGLGTSAAPEAIVQFVTACRAPVRLHQQTGRTIATALEPPMCYLEQANWYHFWKPDFSTGAVARFHP
jgi:hypothetical protein